MEGQGDSSSGSKDFAHSNEKLLGSENIHSKITTENGLLVLTDRRIVVLEETKTGLGISNAAPLDLISEIVIRDDKDVVFKCHKTDEHGVIIAKERDGEIEFDLFDIVATPGQFITSRKLGVYVDKLNDILGKLCDKYTQSSGHGTEHDLSYLEDMPAELTKDTVLILNVIFSSYAEEDFMISPARTLFGEKPIGVLHTINREKDGYLFVVGTDRTVNVEGKFENQVLLDSHIDCIPNDSILSVTTDWEKVSRGIVHINFSEKNEQEPEYRRLEIHWNPPSSRIYDSCKWFNEPANAPWIIADFLGSQGFGRVPANHFDVDVIDHPKVISKRHF